MDRISKINKICIFILSFLLIILVSVNIFNLFSTVRIRTINANYITTYDDIEAFGVFLRDETIVYNKNSNLVHLNVSSGNRVSKNQDIAYLYTNEKYLEQSMELNLLKKDLDTINKVTAGNQNLSDLQKSTVRINNLVSEINGQMDKNNLKTTLTTANEIKINFLKNAYLTMDKKEITDKKTQLSSAISQKQQELRNQMTIVKAETTGSFVSGVDGYEGLKEVTVESIQQMQNKNILTSSNTDVIGKIITSREWEFATIVDTNEIERIQKATKVRLVFENMPTREVEVNISKISEDNNGTSIIYFKGRLNNEEILEIRASNVKIVLREYQGLKIPKSATRIVDGKLGIYTLNGPRAMFKEISPIFEKDDYYLIEVSNSATSKDIIIGDKIIINSTSLDSSKIIS